MTHKQTHIYKCPVCDTVVEVLEPCGLELVCCGPQMVKLREKVCGPTAPHALLVERHGDGVRVRVGNPTHPMERDHQIIWIEISAAGMCYRQFLRPGQKPEAHFSISTQQPIVARVYCNAHGLWRSADSFDGHLNRLAVTQSPRMVSDILML